MCHRAVEVLAAHDADEPVALGDEDPALAVALADDERAGDRLVWPDRACRARHQRTGDDRLAHERAEPLLDSLLRVREPVAEDRRSGLRVSAAAEQLRDRSGVDLGGPAAGNTEDPAVHLDEQDERLAVGHVDDFVGQVRDAVHVARPGDRGDEHLDACELSRFDRLEDRSEQLPLVLGERRVQELREQLLAGAVTKAPREGLRVALGRARVRERARVLVDAERECGRLERRHRDLALGEDPDQRGREGAVLGDHDVLGRGPFRQIARVVVEDDLLDVRVERDLLELPQAGRVHRLDDDQAPDRVELESGGLREPQLVRVQPVELAHVPVERARQAGDRVRVEPPCGQHRREGVEVGVPVGRDDRFRAHVASLCLRATQGQARGHAKRHEFVTLP